RHRDRPRPAVSSWVVLIITRCVFRVISDMSPIVRGVKGAIMKRTFLGFVAIVAALAAAPEYKVTGKIKVGGNGGWDYVYIDSDAQRWDESHTNQTEGIDLAKNEKVGVIAETTGVHGIAIAADLGKGFTSNGRANTVSVFDPKTLMVSGKIDTGKNP